MIRRKNRSSVEFKRLNAFGMVGAISKFISSHAGSYPLRFLSVLFLCAAPVQEADAALVSLDYSGTFQLSSGTDNLGIDGASFHYTLIYDNSALRSNTNNLNTDWWFLWNQTGSSLSLTISGSLSNDGTYQASNVQVFELNGGSFDSLYTSGYFDINGSDLSDYGFSLPGGFTGAISTTNTISAISTSDVDTFGLQWTDESTFTSYSVQSAIISTQLIPEPTIPILLAISATAFILRRGRMKAT